MATTPKPDFMAAPTIPPAGDGVLSLYVTCVLLSLSWFTIALRIWVRNRVDAFGLDDWLMCIGLLLYSVTAGLVITCCFHGSGQMSKDIPPLVAMKGVKLFYIAEFFYASCTVPIKCSICVTLLRIATARRPYELFLYAIIALVIISTIIFNIAVGNLCQPVEALWGEKPGVCNASLNSSVGFFFSAVAIVTDLSLAIVPGFLLWNVQMKGRVKISVALILGLAAFASCATIIRLRYLTLYNDQKEFMFSTGAIGLWSVVEEGIGLIAGSLPALRPLLGHRIFGGSTGDRSGGPSGSGKLGGRSGSGFNQMPDAPPEPGAVEAVGLGPMRPPRRRNPDDDLMMETVVRDSDDDNDSQNHILKETEVVVTAEPGPADNDWARRQAAGWNTGRK